MAVRLDPPQGEPPVVRVVPTYSLQTLVRTILTAVGVLRAYERAPDGSWRDGLLMDLLADELVEDEMGCPTGSVPPRA